MTNPGVGWSQLMRAYNDDTVITITNLEIMWLTRYPGWQEVCMTEYLEFLVLSFNIPNNIEWIIYAVMSNPYYPLDNSSIKRIYQEANV